MKKLLKSQAMITLVIFVAIGMIIISGAIVMIGVNTLAVSSTEKSLIVKQAAESGMENALLRLLRDPTYTGETLAADVNGYPTTITVTGDLINKTVISTATSLTFQRKIITKIDYTGNVMKVIHWEDIE